MHPIELHNDKLRNITGFIQLYSLKCRCICHMKFLCTSFFMHTTNNKPEYTMEEKRLPRL